LESYEQAFEELQQIIHDIESGEISIDSLSEKVKRASVLIAYCKNKLTNTELDVQKILDELKSK
jgi:exodeoxyribonuclease VII small subunit